MTDIGIDLKALEISTFMRITGLTDQEQAKKYKEIAWKAVSYITHKYSGKVFLGVGIPYNKELNYIVEVSRIVLHGKLNEQPKIKLFEHGTSINK